MSDLQDLEKRVQMIEKFLMQVTELIQTEAFKKYISDKSDDEFPEDFPIKFVRDSLK